MTPLVRSVRWAFGVMWLGSLVWLGGCIDTLLGWRGPGTVFVAWSVLALPVFVATSEWRARTVGEMSSLWRSGAVTVWAASLWWLAATPVVPGSPAQFQLGTAVGGVAALSVLVWQATLLVVRLPRPRAVQHARRAGVAPVATLIRAH